MSEVDPLYVFQLANPFTDLASAPADDGLLARIISTPLGAPAPRRRRPWIIGGAVAVAALATAAFAYVRYERAENPTGLNCYEGDSLDSNRHRIGPSSDPVAACGELWTDGKIDSLPTPPPLAGCVTAEDIAAVLPGDPSLCSRLGLESLDPTQTPEGDAVVALHEQLQDLNASSGCATEPATRQAVARILGQLALDNWSIVVAEGFPEPGLPCVIASVVDPAAHEVLISGVPEPPGS
jgi:hypothetical protein